MWGEKTPLSSPRKQRELLPRSWTGERDSTLQKMQAILFICFNGNTSQKIQLSLCLPQKAEILIESSQGHVCTAGAHITELVLPTAKLETALRPAQSLFRRISSPRMTLKQTTGFCRWPWAENTYGCSPNWLTVGATPWCCVWPLK